MKILIQDKDGVHALEEGFASEAELQTFLREHPDLMPLEEIDLNAPPLLCIGWEVGLASGAEDILYIDENGLLTVVETKLRKNPEARREVVGQILEYAAQMSSWTSSDVERQAQKFFASSQSPDQYRGRTLEEALQQFLESAGGPPDFSYDDFLEHVQTNIERGHFRLVIAIDEPPEPLLKIVEFVNRFSERFEMFLIQLKRFRDLPRQQNIFVPALFGRVPRPEAPHGPGRPWDKEAFLEQAGAKSPESVPVLKRLIEFAAGEKAIVWGRGASLGTFRFCVPCGNGKLASVFSGYGHGKVLLDFKNLSELLGADAVTKYRDDLKRIRDIPVDVVTSETWKEFDPATLSPEASWDAFVAAVLSLKAAVAERTAYP